MKPITIPKKALAKDDLVILGRAEYERLLRAAKFYQELDRDLAVALTEAKTGKTIGPFESADELVASLRR